MPYFHSALFGNIFFIFLPASICFCNLVHEGFINRRDSDLGGVRGLARRVFLALHASLLTPNMKNTKRKITRSSDKFCHSVAGYDKSCNSREKLYLPSANIYYLKKFVKKYVRIHMSADSLIRLSPKELRE